MSVLRFFFLLHTYVPSNGKSNFFTMMVLISSALIWSLLPSHSILFIAYSFAGFLGELILFHVQLM